MIRAAQNQERILRLEPTAMRFPPALRPLASAVLCLALGAATVRPALAADPEGSGLPFYITREPVPGGAELLTVLGRVDPGDPNAPADVPLVSVMRDTLGDDRPENDRLRYVWVHGYTTPTFTQRMASAVPFLNRRMGNKKPSSATGMPPSVIDLAAPERDVWNNVMWIAAQSLFFDPYGVVAKTSVRAFRRNNDDYRKAHIIRALAVLSLYEAETGAAPVLSQVEMRDIQARLMLAQRSFGGIIADSYLDEAYRREAASTLDLRGHNWELLRQRVEAEGLYFEPLAMPDGSATHALVWVAKSDVSAQRPFNSRFLNIKNPWGDKRLIEWTGYRETRYVDALNRPVAPDAPGARALEMIPLALYGLDHPKIPVVLIDFRDQGNPKRREVSRRVLNDITRNVLSLSPWGDLQYFLGQSIYNFVTGRRGMDLNQPSRLRSYSQLKLLLSLSSTLDPELAAEAGRLVERVSMNPLQNDGEIEVALSHASYAALQREADTPNGKLAAMLQRDRRAEFARLEHGRTARVFLTTATIVTAGIYRHREPVPAAEQLARLDTSRQLAYHTRFLEEVLASTPVIEVAWNIDDVRRSVEFIADHGAQAGERASRLAARVFASTEDFETRRLSVLALTRLDTESSRRALGRIAREPGLEPQLQAALSAGPSRSTRADHAVPEQAGRTSSGSGAGIASSSRTD